MNFVLWLSNLKHSPRLAGIRKYTNLLYYDPYFVNIDMRNFDVIEVDGYKFYINDQVRSIQKVKDNPWFEGVRPTDVVVDIGANIGAITIPLASKARLTYAVEPLYHKELQANLDLNNLPMVVVILGAIGPRGWRKLMFSSREEEVFFLTFKELKDRVGEQIDFLKMDGEGCEWDIQPNELKGIRELRLEFHIRRASLKGDKRKFKEYLDWMDQEAYEVHCECPNYGPDPHDKKDYVVRASLKEKSK